MPKYNPATPKVDGIGPYEQIQKHLADAPTCTPTTSLDNVVQSQSPSVVPFVFKAASGQTADLLQFQDSTGTTIGAFSSAGVLNGGSTPSLTAKQLLISEQKRRSVFGDIYLTEGVAGVTLCFDDGVAADNTTVYPYLRDKYIPATFAVVKSLIGTTSYMTWAQIKAIHDYGFEIAAHSRTHGSPPADFATFVDEAVTSADEIALTDGTWQASVDTFVQPGTWNSGPYFFDIPSKMDLTDAGDQLRARFPAVCAYLTDGMSSQVIQVPFLRRHGISRQIDLAAVTLSQLQQYVARARGCGGVVACGTHAGNLGQVGFNTVATWKTMIDFLADERDAGRVEFFTQSAGWHVQHNTAGRRNLVQDGSFLQDANSNLLDWLKLGGSPTVNAADAPSGGNSLTINGTTDQVALHYPAANFRTINVKFSAKNDASGTDSNARLILRGTDDAFTTIYNSLDLTSGDAATPGPWAAVTDDWQTFECYFRLDARATQLIVWPYYTTENSKTGAVRYADFEIYKS